MALQPFKPWKSFAEQVNLLEQRGMVFHDKQQAEKELERIGYYRLSAYWYPFRVLPLPQPKIPRPRQDNFIVGTEFNHVIALYEFDNAIKILALEAIQHIEIALRVQIAYRLGTKDVVAHTNSKYFSTFIDENGKTLKFEAWKNKYEASRQNSKDDFVRHNLSKYGELPIWVACEIWDLGSLSRFYQGINLRKEKQEINNFFDLFHDELTSHIVALNFVRNVAAHHGRLWNRNPVIGTPVISNFTDMWQYLDNQKPFVVFCLMKRMLNLIEPNQAKDWGLRFQAALNKFPKQNAHMVEVNLQKFGIGIFPKTGQEIDLSKWKLWK